MNIGGTVAVIVGDSAGAGREMALALAGEGLRVAVIADVDEAAGAETARLVTEAGTRGIFVRTDVTDPEQAFRLIDGTQMQHTRLDILCIIASAAVEPFDLFEEATAEDAWRSEIDVRLTATVRATRLGVLKMRELGRGGVIVIATPALDGSRSAPASPLELATTGAILSFTRSLAYLHDDANVRVNAIYDGTAEALFSLPVAATGSPGPAAPAGAGATVPTGQALVQLIFDDDRAGTIFYLGRDVATRSSRNGGA